MMKRIEKYSLLIIILLAAILRLWGLNSYPVGLNADEAAIGYNVYSLIQTGKDEHGHFWPIHFESFGDFKPGLYFYLVLPLVKILGLNIWAVRLPSAILGTFSVWLIYLLARELFKNQVSTPGVVDVSLLAALFLAISPWHLHFSRGGWETNTASFFILAGVYFFLKGLKKPQLFLLSAIAFVFSLYTYHSARIVVPLLVLSLLVIYRKDFFKKPKWSIWAGIVGLILIIPLALDFFGPAGISRFAGVGLLSDTGPFWRINELRGQHSRLMSLPVRLLHNRVIGYLIAFAENWLDHFHGEFLFISGEVIARNRVPETGQMHLFDIPFVILGAYFLLKHEFRTSEKTPPRCPKDSSDGEVITVKLTSEESLRATIRGGEQVKCETRVKDRLKGKVVFLWLAVAPVAAAMTFQTPHALRAHNMVIPLIIISAYGFYQSWLWIRARTSKVLTAVFWLLTTVVFFWCSARYLHQYYVHYPQAYPSAWEDGFAPLANYLKEKEDNYERIYVTDRYDQPYILFLFYLQYPPEKFQKEVKLTKRDQFGFSTVRDLANFHFEAIDWERLKEERNILIVGTDEEIPDSANIIKRIYFKNQEVAFEIAEL